MDFDLALLEFDWHSEFQISILHAWISIGILLSGMWLRPTVLFVNPWLISVDLNPFVASTNASKPPLA
jgi:hypothetical protein